MINSIQSRNVYFGIATSKKEQTEKNKPSSLQDGTPKIVLPPANLSNTKPKDKIIQALPIITSTASLLVAGVALYKLKNTKASLKNQINGNFKELSGQINNIIPQTSIQVSKTTARVENFSEQIKQFEIRQDGFEKQLKHCKVAIKGLRNAHEELRNLTDKIADRLKGIFGCLTQNKIFSDKQIRQIFHECK